jgi:hypothetical protein
MKYDIHNPTPAARVIYDGISKNGKPDGAQTAYHFPSGATRKGIELSDVVAEELKKRTAGRDDAKADLILTPHVEGEHEPKPTTKTSTNAEKPLLGLKK